MPETIVEEIIEEPKETLTEEESEDFKNLIVVGMISDEFDLMGHKILLRTLSTKEDLCVGLLVKPYLDSSSFQRAYKTAIVAAATREIDGELLLGSLKREPDDLELMRLKFNKINEYYPVVIDAIYSRFVELEKKLLPVVSRLGKTQS